MLDTTGGYLAVPGSSRAEPWFTGARGSRKASQRQRACLQGEIKSPCCQAILQEEQLGLQRTSIEHVIAAGATVAVEAVAVQRVGVQGLREQAMPGVPVGGAGAAWKAGPGRSWHADWHAARRLRGIGESTALRCKNSNEAQGPVGMLVGMH